jgi:hypothetical protein
MNNSETVVALYNRLDNAHAAVRELVAAGFSRDDISLVANNVTGEYSRSAASDDVTGEEGAGFGAVVGSLTGVMVGLTAIAIPGIGPIIAAGPLAALLGGTTGAAVGAVLGAVTGGITASLVNVGVPEDEAEYYAESVRRGDILVTVTANGDDARDAMNIMQRHYPVNVENRATEWRKSGWEGFDPEGDPYDADALARERAMYGKDSVEQYDDAVRNYPKVPPPIR